MFTHKPHHLTPIITIGIILVFASVLTWGIWKNEEVKNLRQELEKISQTENKNLVCPPDQSKMLDACKKALSDASELASGLSKVLSTEQKTTSTTTSTK